MAGILAKNLESREAAHLYAFKRVKLPLPPPASIQPSDPTEGHRI
ncbi:hypothetical protein RSSM_06102 [Rhodopirellula sallentina SM41]|uniref:Uncharacterized protein n=1 Tax=Rhodopirellula sallentina SM41 TaxID=1263870 RepID=M5TTA3_9BACT|nr:hypothetical protein RSSM_06102 [Rhodopirellula sallentina SM41]